MRIEPVSPCSVFLVMDDVGPYDAPRGAGTAHTLRRHAMFPFPEDWHYPTTSLVQLIKPRETKLL
jgi:hypothetical protein